MTSENVLRLYKQGYSIDYIINQYYLSKKKENKIINLRTRKIILVETRVKKSDVRGEVYKIIYAYIKN